MHSISLKKPKSFFANVRMCAKVRRAYNENQYDLVYRQNRDLTSFETSVLQTFLKSISFESPSIIDIGCGTGRPYDRFLISNNCSVLGIDLSKRHIVAARANVPQGTYICKDFLQYKDKKLYDGAMMLYSLFHIHRDYHKTVLEKVYNFLNNNGKLLLNVRKEDCGDIKYKENFCGKPMYWSHYDFKTFKDIAETVGFRVKVLGDEKDYGSSESHLWILLKKHI